ncbi:MAG: hypothetical protein ACLQVD_05390 [Capsulimonadaceae bacterium]
MVLACGQAAGAGRGTGGVAGGVSMAQLTPMMERLGAAVVLAAEEAIPDSQCRTRFLDAVTERWCSLRGEGNLDIRN